MISQALRCICFMVCSRLVMSSQEVCSLKIQAVGILQLKRLMLHVWIWFTETMMCSGSTESMPWSAILSAHAWDTAHFHSEAAEEPRATSTIRRLFSHSAILQKMQETAMVCFLYTVATSHVRQRRIRLTRHAF